MKMKLKMYITTGRYHNKDFAVIGHTADCHVDNLR